MTCISITNDKKTLQITHSYMSLSFFIIKNTLNWFHNKICVTNKQTNKTNTILQFCLLNIVCIIFSFVYNTYTHIVWQEAYRYTRCCWSPNAWKTPNKQNKACKENQVKSCGNTLTQCNKQTFNQTYTITHIRIGQCSIGE